MNTQEPKKSQSQKIQGIIVAIVAVLLIGGALAVQSNARPQGSEDITFTQVTDADHIRGNINAPVKVIEYSDLECPFCKDFHATMNQLFNEYGIKDQIVWAYRHFPLDNLHKKARTEAMATECVAKLGGDEAFWKMTDSIFEITTANDGLDLSILPTLAEKAGVNRNQFLKCFNAKETAGEVQADAESGAAAGASGTPYTLVISPKGNVFPIGGAFPYAQAKQIIEKALNDK
ncbi:MAG: hypothetical protein RIQ72_113 [Candidatus Parcubacteria bacterium]|jgi:protein-disulfide isomerase